MDRGADDQWSFGFALDARHDCTGDGIRDLVVGAPGHDGSGSVSVIDGAARKVVWTARPTTRVGLFGHDVAMSPDVDEDGVADVLVGHLGVGGVVLSGVDGTRITEIGGCGLGPGAGPASRSCDAGIAGHSWSWPPRGVIGKTPRPWRVVGRPASGSTSSIRAAVPWKRLIPSEVMSGRQPGCACEAQETSMVMVTTTSRSVSPTAIWLMDPPATARCDQARRTSILAPPTMPVWGFSFPRSTSVRTPAHCSSRGAASW